MANYYDKNQPKYNWGNGWTKKGVTEKQANYLEVLSEKTSVALKNTENMTRGDASGLIDELRRIEGVSKPSYRYLIRDYSEYVELGD